MERFVVRPEGIDRGPLGLIPAAEIRSVRLDDGRARVLGIVLWGFVAAVGLAAATSHLWKGPPSGKFVLGGFGITLMLALQTPRLQRFVAGGIGAYQVRLVTLGGERVLLETGDRAFAEESVRAIDAGLRGAGPAGGSEIDPSRATIRPNEVRQTAAP